MALLFAYVKLDYTYSISQLSFLIPTLFTWQSTGLIAPTAYLVYIFSYIGELFLLVIHVEDRTIVNLQFYCSKSSKDKYKHILFIEYYYNSSKYIASHQV